MKSARRLKRARKKKAVGFRSFISFSLLLLIPLLAFVLFKFSTKYWNGSDKVVVAHQKSDGSVELSVYDPQREEITTLVISGDTEIEVSKNLGTLRLKNVWQLGVNEGMEGALLTQTITRNFLFPVFLWSREGKDNIPLGDNLSIWLFERKVKGIGRNEVDLAKGQFLTRSKLSDGDLGYRIPGAMSDRLTIYFSDEDFYAAPGGVKAYIKDQTGTFGVAEKVGEIVEVMGGKVVTIDKSMTDGEIDCVITGTNSKAVTKISRILSCKVGREKSDFDLEINLGGEAQIG